MTDTERVSSTTHWLLFDTRKRIIGCHCGFNADIDSDAGYGDSVVDHLVDVGRRLALRAVRAELAQRDLITASPQRE